MKLLCLPIAFLYAVVKGQLAGRLASCRTPISALGAGRRVFHGNYVTANFADLSSVSILIYTAYISGETRHNPNRQILKGAAQNGGE